MTLALKEWSAVLSALTHGRQLLLLRKGGLIEHRRGFQLQHTRFLLYPTFEHQHATHIRPEFAHTLSPPADESTIHLTLFADAADAVPAPADPALLETATAWHIYNPDFIRLRYSYRPDLPLWLIPVRVFRLPRPAALPVRPAYAGCKSWIHLTEQVAIDDPQPVLSNDEFASSLAALRSHLSLPLPPEPVIP